MIEPEKQSRSQEKGDQKVEGVSVRRKKCDKPLQSDNKESEKIFFIGNSLVWQAKLQDDMSPMPEGVRR